MNYSWSKNPGFRCTNKVVPQPVVNKVTTPLMGVMINPSDTHWFSAIKIGGRFLSLHSYRSARGHLGKNILVVTFSCMTLLLRTKKKWRDSFVIRQGLDSSKWNRLFSKKSSPLHCSPTEWVNLSCLQKVCRVQKKGAQVQPLNSLVGVCWWNSVGSPEAFDAQSLNGSKSSDFLMGFLCGSILISYY